MEFPITLDVKEGSNTFTTLSFYNGCLTLIGQNGSGKTQLLRKIKDSIAPLVNGKKIHYLSAGRIGLFEQYRSDYDGNRRRSLRYDEAQFGSKTDTDKRHNFETISGGFHTLSVRADVLIKVQERLHKLFNRSLFIEWDAGNLKVSLKRNDIKSTATYSSAREASGLIQLIAILSALYDDEIGALLLDEPEVSLHPQLQSFLKKEIEKYAGDIQQNKKLIVLATHSTEFIKVSSTNDLCNIVFCNDSIQPPIQLKPDMDDLKERKLHEFLSRIGQEHKLAFFAMRPLLVEGPSDSIICHGLERKLDMYIEAAGVQIVPIIGKGEFPIVYRFFKLIGKEPIILADGDAFTDSMDIPLLYVNSKTAKDMVANNGGSTVNAFIKNIYNDFCKLADSQVENLRDLLETTAYWKNKKSDDDTIKIYRRAFLSLIYTDTTTDLLMNNEGITAMKQRIESLMSILNKVGCFILRKGTIESYYAHSHVETAHGKPIAAVDEVSFLNDKEKEFILSQYSDICHCLQFATQTKEINEIEALRDLLLSAIAPILGMINEKTTQNDVQTKIRSIIGERGELFDIILDSTNKSKVTVNVKSKILEVQCFPFEINKSDNLILTINSKLGLVN